MRITPSTIVALVTGLASTAAAVDVGLLLSSNCGGDIAYCTGYNPDTCCGGSWWWGAALRYVPREWDLELRLHTGGSCGPVQFSLISGGQEFVCFRSIAGQSTSGAGYGFRRKREVDGSEAEGPCPRPDVLQLGDGSEYSLAELTDEQYDQV
ncbi:hypothetical protein MN608_08614 [Microdochium nivale]|nr:hypothetical protein MN608_08614 [Microdochium nivale]